MFPRSITTRGMASPSSPCKAGVPVKLGNGGFERKLAGLARVYKDLKAQMQGLDYIDLDFSDKIIVKKV